MPLSVYLDSSDYSVLSDPAKAEREAPGVLGQLMQFRDEGVVEFFFSAAHLTEMAPIRREFVDAGGRRANLLVELCGGNCMIHHETLFRAEVRAALGLSSANFVPIDRGGRWFPEGAAEFLPITRADEIESTRSAIAGILPNGTRAQRRQAERKIIKGGKLLPEIRVALQKNAQNGDLSEILAMYPMRADAARILAKYVAGTATADEASAALEMSFCDPRLVLQWFEKDHNKISPFVAWARGPAAEMADKVLGLANLIESARSNLLDGGAAIEAMYSGSRWNEWQSQMLSEIANRLSEELKPGARLDVAEIDRNCPGISTAIRSLHSAWRSITFDKPRKPKPSDFVDALHATYAPYVDVFRADGFMTEHIGNRVSKFGTKVVAKLALLPQVLRDLDSRE